MFGNLDDTNCSRSMVTAMATKNVDLLQIDTREFYKILKGYPVILRRLNKHILFESMFYVQQKQMSQNSSRSMCRFNRDLSKTSYHVIHFTKDIKVSMQTVKIPITVCSYLSLIFITYHAAFQRHNIAMWIITYLLDIIHIVHYSYLIFLIPFWNQFGIVVIDRKLIRNNVLKSYSFYINLIANLPLELLAPAFVSTALPQAEYFKKLFAWIAMLRLSKALRVVS